MIFVRTKLVELHRTLTGNETREGTQSPWECEDTRVRRAWEALTNPRNELALEILSHQLPGGSQLKIIRKALQVSRDRKDKEQSSGH